MKRSEPPPLDELGTPSEIEELGAIWARMTPAMQQYINARLSGVTRTGEALAAAGYAHDGRATQRIVQHPAVLRYLALASRAAARRAVLTRADVLQGLKDAVEAASSSTELTLAWKEIGKILGVYAPQQVELGVTVKEMDSARIASMSMAQLIELTRHQGIYTLSPEEDQTAPMYESLSRALTPPIPIEGTVVD
jgi:hypothetical protein